MENAEEITKKIRLITNEIREKYPELIEFLNETPDTVPNVKHPDIDIAALTTYYKSLVSLKEKYSTQQHLKQNQHD